MNFSKFRQPNNSKENTDTTRVFMYALLQRADDMQMRSSSVNEYTT